MQDTRRHIERLPDLIVAALGRAWQVTETVEGTDRVFRLYGDGQLSAAVTLTVSDALHHLRSCLDNLVWQLALGPTGKPHKQLKWPVPREGGGRVTGKPLNGLSDEARARVVRMQWPGDDRWLPLWRLHEMSIMDKHQTLPLVSQDLSAPLGFIVHTPDDAGLRTLFATGAAAQGRASAGDVLLRLPADAERMGVGWDLTIVFEGGPCAGRPVYDELVDLHDFIAEQVLPEFYDLLPDLASLSRG